MCGWAQNLIFRFLQSRQKVQIWLFEQTDLRIEGRIIVRLQCLGRLCLHVVEPPKTCEPV